MDILGIIANAVITAASVSLASYLTFKLTVRSAKKSLAAEAEAWLSSEKGRNALYLIGGMIANGAKAGFGLKGAGKPKLEDIILSIAGQYLPNILPGLKQGQQEQPAPQY